MERYHKIIVRNSLLEANTFLQQYCRRIISTTPIWNSTSARVEYHIIYACGNHSKLADVTQI